MRARLFAVACCLLIFVPAARAQTVRVGVLGRFHPRQMVVRAVESQALILTVDDQRFSLESGSASSRARIALDGNFLRVDVGGKSIRAKAVRIASRNNGAADVVLTVPGKISRRYRGVLTVTVAGHEVVPIVEMDLETAVASAVQAESGPSTPDEALKAQAVVSRSYYVAGGGRHEQFDFCDLTHCQLLRDPPELDSAASRATAATRALVLVYQDRPVAAMFTRSCGGKTLTPSGVGLPIHGYPYFSVECSYCREHPARWARTVSGEDAALLLKRGEAGRLEVDRRLGWNAVPSNSFTAHAENGETLLRGKGQGHGIGLCQRGARDMARQGAAFREILSRYFPNTGLQIISDSFAK